MKYQITEEKMISFRDWLRREERSEGTIEKYLRDLRAYWRFLGGESANKRGSQAI